MQKLNIKHYLKMKLKFFKPFQFFLLFAVIFILESCSNPNERHFGEWKGTDNSGKSASLILDKSNHAVLVQENQVIGGNEFEINGIKGECKYEIDYTKNPIWLDLVIYEQGKAQEIGRLKGIIRFITEDKIEYRVNFDGERFDKFDSDDKEHTIVLDKETK
jgi:hypothetical protein